MKRDTVIVDLDRDAARGAIDIWREASEWLRDRGLAQWDAAIFDDRFLDETFAIGTVVGATIEGVLAGVAILQWSDEVWWPDRPDESAAYIHKLAVRRAFAGRGIADDLVRACEARAKDAGRTIMRLDTGADRAVLLSLYERLGYTAIDKRTVDGFNAVRFEKLMVSKNTS